MSFFTLPPEINSLRMLLGAGSTPMLQALNQRPRPTLDLETPTQRLTQLLDRQVA
jgi:hypothetical protein